MSYILEALKKSELQREIGQVPGIDSEHEKPLRPASGKWLWVGIGVLLLNAGLLAVLLWPKAEQDTAREAGRIADPAARQQPAPVVQAPRRIDKPAAPVAETVRQQQPVRREPVPVAAPLTPPVQQAASLPPAAAPQPVIEQPAVSVQPGYARPEPAARAGLDDLPLWPQIPGHLFRQLSGGLRLDVHVYSAMSQDRFVLINLQKYHEGEQLQEGPLLDAITSEGVILSFQGQQFRVSAQ
ncbi:MAG TPA: hypothetical protein ENJ80_06400 [Gammaproteobacteria bacterium]|nr:hypothetical protein [Gammaproteobacteria bacterium]